MNFGAALIYSLLGMCVVFFALVFLMVIIRIMTAVSDGAEKKAVPAAPVAPVAPVAPAAPVAAGGIPAPDVSAPVQKLTAYAPGSAGAVKLYDTEPRTAAMLMAIVADELKAPINELRFISIREIKEDKKA